MAQRPVDPAARAGRPGRPAAAVRRGRAGRRPDRPDAVRRRAARPAADHLGAPADARRHRRPRRLPVGRRPRRRPGDCSCRSAGMRPRRSRRSIAAREVIADVGRGRRSRPTSSSRRSARWPRRAAGRPATCSWPSASRSPAGPRRRRCSTRSSRSVASGRSSGSTRAVAVLEEGRCPDDHARRPGLARPLHRRLVEL